MEILNKRDFIELLICTMAKNGNVVETFNLKDEIFLRLDDLRYEKLFFFFRSLRDLEFESVLTEFTNEDFTDCYKVSENQYYIKLTNKFINQYDSVLSKYDKSIVDVMEKFIREIDLSKQMIEYAPHNNTISYCLTNPNRIYSITEDMRIITNGIVRKLGNNKCLVEDAQFVFVESFLEDKLQDIKIYYPFDDIRYINNIVEQLLKIETLKYLRSMGEFTPREKVEDNFTQESDGVTIRYRGL